MMNGRKFGVELEVIGMTDRAAKTLLREKGLHVTSTNEEGGWVVKQDGSLRSDIGFEVTSPALEYTEENLNEIRKVCQVLIDAGCGTTDHCGLHVHIDASEMTPYQFINIMDNYKDTETTIDKFIRFGRRANMNEYCNTMTRINIDGILNSAKYDTIEEMMGHRSWNITSRYLKVNPTSYSKFKTLEFRHFHGSINPDEIVNWVKFLQNFVAQSGEVVGEKTIDVPGRSRQVIVEVQKDVGNLGELFANDDYWFRSAYDTNYALSSGSLSVLTYFFNKYVQNGQTEFTMEELRGTRSQNRIYSYASRTHSESSVKNYISVLNGILKTGYEASVRNNGTRVPSLGSVILPKIKIRKIRNQDKWVFEVTGLENRTITVNETRTVRDPAGQVNIPVLKKFSDPFTGAETGIREYFVSRENYVRGL